MRIGELLLAGRYITENDLHAGLRMHVTHGEQLGECLVSLGAISEDSLLRVLSAQLEIPYYPSISTMISNEAKSLIDKSTALKFKVVPGINDGLRYIFMHEGMESALSWLKSSEVNASPALAKKSDIRLAIDAY